MTMQFDDGWMSKNFRNRFCIVLGSLNSLSSFISRLYFDSPFIFIFHCSSIEGKQEHTHLEIQHQNSLTFSFLSFPTIFPISQRIQSFCFSSVLKMSKNIWRLWSALSNRHTGFVSFCRFIFLLSCSDFVLFPKQIARANRS